MVKKEVTKDKKNKKTKQTTKEKVKNNNPKTSYFKQVMLELSKVKWITFKQMITYTFATLLFCIFFALFFYGLDVVFALIKGWLS